jgi:hypothetical protein
MNVVLHVPNFSGIIYTIIIRNYKGSLFRTNCKQHNIYS